MGGEGNLGVGGRSSYPLRLAIISMIQNEVRKFCARFNEPSFTETPIHVI